MLSRFSSLSVYVVVGLAISAAATPMGAPPGYDDGSKSMSYPGSSNSPSSPKYPEDKPYAKPYAEKPYPEEKKYPKDKYSDDKDMYPKVEDKDKYRDDKDMYPKPDGKDKYPDGKDKYRDDKDMYPKDKYPDGKDKYRDDMDKYPKDKYPEDKDKYPKDKYPDGKDKYPEDKDKYPDGKGKQYSKDKSYNDRPQYNNNCNVGQQHCCNPVNKSDNEESRFGGLLAVLDLMGMGDVTQRIRSSDKFVGTDCSPEGTGDQCNASPMCCEDNYFGGLFAIGCSNIDAEFPIEGM